MRWLVGGVVAVLLWGGSGAAVAARQDEIPADVVAGRDYPVAKSGVAGGELCDLVLGGRRVGGCAGGSPLTGSLRVEPDHPRGSQTLVCRGCWEVPPPRPDEPDVPRPTTVPSEPSEPPTSSTSDEPSESTGPTEPTESTEPTEPTGGVARHREGLWRQPEVVLGTVTVLPPPVTPTTGGGEPALATLSPHWWVAPAVIGLLACALLAAWLILRRRFGDPPDPPEDPPVPDTPPPAAADEDADDGDDGGRPVRVFLTPASLPGVPLPAGLSLAPNSPYLLAVDIGALPGAGPETVPLTVVAFDSPTPTLGGEDVQEVRLTGAAAGRLDFPLHTPPEPERLRWRCGLYCHGVLLQSFVVEADVGQPGGWHVHRDHVTGLDPATLTGIEPHELSLMVDELAVHAFLADARTAVTAPVPAGAAELPPREAGTDRRAMARTLGPLARQGLTLWTAIRPPVDAAVRARGLDPEPLWRRLAGEARVQVAWPRGRTCPLPLGIVYDYPLDEVDPAELGLCERYLADLDAGETPACLSGECVSASPAVVCPAGFWGYRLRLSCANQECTCKCMGANLSILPRIEESISRSTKEGEFTRSSERDSTKRV